MQPFHRFNLVLALAGSLLLHSAIYVFLHWQPAKKEFLPDKNDQIVISVIDTPKAIPAEKKPVPRESQNKMPRAAKSRERPPMPTPPIAQEVGVNETEVDAIPGAGVPPVIRSFEPPTYTRAARMAQLEGRFLGRVLVKVNGEVADASLSQTIGFGMDQRLLLALHRAKFVPATDENGQTREVWTDVAIDLVLH